MMEKNKKCIITMDAPHECCTELIQGLERLGYECVWRTQEVHTVKTDDELLELATGASIVINGGERWSRKVFEGLADLKLLIRFGAGYDAVDLKAAADLGIPVCYLPGANSQAVAEQAIALMLATLRKIPLEDSFMRQGKAAEGRFTVPQLSGKTVSVLGGGMIGEKLIHMLSGFNCPILLCDPVRKPHLEQMKNVQYVDTDYAIAHGDIVSLNLPLMKDTYHLINKDSLARMKKGSVLINTARGGLVNSKDLYEALASKHLYAAGLDVFEEEGTEIGQIFKDLDNVVMTPHVASGTFETYCYMAQLSLDIIQRFCNGQELMNVLNPEYAGHSKRV